MKLVKQFFLVCSMLLFVSSLSLAQGKKKMSPEKMAAKQTEQMKSDLSLSAEQEASVNPINLVFAKQRSEVRKKTAGDGEKMRSEMKRLNKEKSTALAKVLTEEQMAKYKEIQKERRMKKAPQH